MNKILAIGTALAMFATAAPAFADMNSSSITIAATSSGSIDNTTSASAKTGGNDVNGGKGGKGGSGGDVAVEGVGGSFNNGGATAGHGGSGGTGGDGGTIVTGNANADAGTVNTLNTNDVAIGPNGDMNSSSVVVALASVGCGCNDGSSGISNTTRAKARTGGNDANGGKGGKGGSGGEITVDGSAASNNNNGGAAAGNGGNGGVAGWGGNIHTGVATSNAGTVNVLNSNIVRVNH